MKQKLLFSWRNVNEDCVDFIHVYVEIKGFTKTYIIKTPDNIIFDKSLKGAVSELLDYRLTNTPYIKDVTGTLNDAYMIIEQSKENEKEKLNHINRIRSAYDVRLNHFKNRHQLFFKRNCVNNLVSIYNECLSDILDVIKGEE